MQPLKYPKGPVVPAFQEFKSLSSFEIKLWDKRLLTIFWTWVLKFVVFSIFLLIGILSEEHFKFTLFSNDINDFTLTYPSSEDEVEIVLGLTHLFSLKTRDLGDW